MFILIIFNSNNVLEENLAKAIECMYVCMYVCMYPCENERAEMYKEKEQNIKKVSGFLSNRINYKCVVAM